jgi:nucleoside phosphorylase
MNTNTYSRPQGRDAFEVAIICALSIEADAMIALLDDNWELEEQYEKADGDTNIYTIGRVGQHHVVLVHMPRMGKVSAASVAANLRSSFSRIRLGLLVGICGGVPFTDGGKREIILGDVIISTEIVQTDFGRQYPDSFVRKDTPQDNLGRPSPEIQGFLSRLQGKAAQTELEEQMGTNLVTILDAEGFEYSTSPGVQEDKLYEDTYRHKHQDANACTICVRCVKPEDAACVKSLDLPCAELGCDASKVVPRARIQKMIDQGSCASVCHSVVHFGRMASGDQVMKSAQHRDWIAKQENIIAFEM